MYMYISLPPLVSVPAFFIITCISSVKSDESFGSIDYNMSFDVRLFVEK